MRIYRIFSTIVKLAFAQRLAFPFPNLQRNIHDCQFSRMHVFGNDDFEMLVGRDDIFVAEIAFYARIFAVVIHRAIEFSPIRRGIIAVQHDRRVGLRIDGTEQVARPHQLHAAPVVVAERRMNFENISLRFQLRIDYGTHLRIDGNGTAVDHFV